MKHIKMFESFDKSDTFPEDKDYKEAKEKLDAYTEAAEALMTKMKRRSITAEEAEALPYSKEVNNELRSKVEKYEFLSEEPINYFLYISKNGTATTWTGQKLGDATLGAPYKSNMGDVRRSVTVKALNGRTYYGTFYQGAGDYARVKLSKKK